MIKMLEFTYYNTEKIDDLKDFFTVSFVLIDDVYCNGHSYLLKYISDRLEKMSC